MRMNCTINPASVSRLWQTEELCMAWKLPLEKVSFQLKLEGEFKFDFKGLGLGTLHKKKLR